MRHQTIAILLTFLTTSNLWGQEVRLVKPKNEIRNSIGTIVKKKTIKSSNPDWSVYADAKMEQTIGRVKIGDSVQVQGWATWLYFIKSKDITGYISWKALEINKNLDSLATVLEKFSPVEEDAEIKKQQEIERKKYEDMLVKKFGVGVANKILDGYYWIGMTEKMAEYSLGRPDKVNRTVTSNSIHEQWIYRNSDLYLYFDNGVLRSYQN